MSMSRAVNVHPVAIVLSILLWNVIFRLILASEFDIIRKLLLISVLVFFTVGLATTEAYRMEEEQFAGIVE